MNVFMINSGYDGCNYLRVSLPCMANGWWTDRTMAMDGRFPLSEIRERLQMADVVMFHRAEEQTYHDLAKMLKKDGKKIVMDNDDTFILGDNHPLMNFNADGSSVDNLKRRHDNLNEFLTMADLVTTTTETLKYEYSKINKNSIILPNCVDPDDWDEPLRNESDVVRIGIVGSAAIEYDYLHLKDFIRELSERDDVEIVMFGLGDMKHRKENPIVTKVFGDEYAFWDSINKIQFPWVKRHQYNETLNEARLDMMLIPRKDNYFNRCKSNVKFLEAAMCEIPVVAQSFKNAPYEEITSDMGVLVKDNNKWAEEVEKLIKDKELRRRLGKNAREYVIKNYDIKDHYHKWADAYKSLF